MTIIPWARGETRRAAGGERVRRRALGRRDDHPVAGVAHEQLAVNAQGERGLTAAGHAGENNIVVGDLRAHAIARGEREAGAFLDRVPALAQRRKRGVEVGGVDLGQVTESAEVDSQDRDTVRRAHAEGAEHRAVATQREN